jgi:hypothetical protein
MQNTIGWRVLGQGCQKRTKDKKEPGKYNNFLTSDRSKGLSVQQTRDYRYQTDSLHCLYNITEPFHHTV